jgi:hypothetical protein
MNLLGHWLSFGWIFQAWQVLETHGNFAWEFVTSLIEDRGLVLINGLVEDVEISGNIGVRLSLLELNVVWSILNNVGVSRPDHSLEWVLGSNDETVENLALALLFLTHIFSFSDMLALTPFVFLGVN